MSDPERVIFRPELQRLFNNVSSETLRRWRKEKRLPEPDVNLSQRTQGWKVSTLRAAGINVV